MVTVCGVFIFLVIFHQVCGRGKKGDIDQHDRVYHKRVGDDFEITCDGTTTLINARNPVITQIFLYKEEQFVVTCTMNSPPVRVKIHDDWSPACSGLFKPNANVGNKNIFTMRVSIPHLRVEDEGMYTCVLMYHETSSITKSETSLTDIAQLYIQDKDHKDGGSNPCHDGWFLFRPNQTCVGVQTEILTHEAATENCGTNYGARLAVIHTKQFDAFLSGLLKLYENKGFWIGLTDNKRESIFEWVTGAKTSYTNWAFNYPAPLDVTMNCVVKGMFSYGEWRDTDCSELHYFICQMTVSEIGLHKRNRDDLEEEIQPNYDVIVITFIVLTLIVLLTVCILMAIPRDMFYKTPDGEEESDDGSEDRGNNDDGAGQAKRTKQDSDQDTDQDVDQDEDSGGS